MRKKIEWTLLFIFLIGLILPDVLFAQRKVPSSFCLHPAEKQLADSINSIRVRNGKKALPLSVSLSFVARVHVTDLLYNHPDTSICNLSSWSDKGPWKACCYNPYVVNHDGMWKKPQELTGYPYHGYEMAAYTQDSLNVDSVLSLWKDSPEALAIILTSGVWSKKSWACMGVGLNHHYASVWFGQRPDKAGKPRVCSLSKKDVSTTGYTYYLIYGSYPTVNLATKVMDNIKSKGFKNVGILRSHKRNRVFVFHSTDFRQLKNEWQKLKKRYPQLWILRK